MTERTPPAYVKATLLSMATRFLGVHEVAGPASNPLLLWMLQRLGGWIKDDATAWCGAFMAFIAWLLERPVPQLPLRARSWLTVGTPVTLDEAVPGFDVVIFTRGDGPQPGIGVLDAPGHVAILSRVLGNYVEVIGGNQGDQVSRALFPVSQILGIRRL